MNGCTVASTFVNEQFMNYEQFMNSVHKMPRHQCARCHVGARTRVDHSHECLLCSAFLFELGGVPCQIKCAVRVIERRHRWLPALTMLD